MKKSSIQVSIITLNYKEAELTIQCVNSLLKSKNILFEILVVDNSCTEKDASKLLSIASKKVKVFIQTKNLGCAMGYNFGIEHSLGKYVFIINNDTVLTDPHALAKMVAFLDSNPRVGVIQPKIKSERKRRYYEYAGAAGGFLDVLGYPFCKGRIFSTVEIDKQQYDKVDDISWASTCAFFARKNVLYKAGLFDPIYFAYAEEVDISIKIWLLGYRVAYFPYTEIYHRGEMSWKKTRGRKTYLIHKNHLILYLKCLPLRQIIINLPFRLLLEYLSMIYYVTNKSNLHVFFVLYSHFVVLLLLPVIIKKRVAFFSGVNRYSAPLYNKSIVVDYFWYHKSTFLELDKNKIVRNIP